MNKEQIASYIKWKRVVYGFDQPKKTSSHKEPVRTYSRLTPYNHKD